MTNESQIEMIKAGFTITAVSLIQVCLFVIAYDASVEFYMSRFGHMNRIFGFGMQIDNGMLLLCILAGLNSAANVISKNIYLRVAVSFICSVTWIFYWSNIADVVPNRFLLLTELGMASFLSGVLLTSRNDADAIYLR